MLAQHGDHERFERQVANRTAFHARLDARRAAIADELPAHGRNRREPSRRDARAPFTCARGVNEGTHRPRM
jgi:hypothetical protein